MLDNSSAGYVPLPEVFRLCWEFERYVPAEAVAAYRELGVTMCGGSTAFYQMYLAEQRKSPDAPIIPTLNRVSGSSIERDYTATTTRLRRRDRVDSRLHFKGEVETSRRRVGVVGREILA